MIVSFVQYFQLLLDNLQEVAEPYVYEKKNVLTGLKETIVNENDVNAENSLSSHLTSYIKQIHKVDDEN